MIPHRQAGDVLKDEVPRVELKDHPGELVDELVAGVVERPLADERESLAGGAANDRVNLPVADAGAGRMSSPDTVVTLWQKVVA